MKSLLTLLAALSFFVHSHAQTNALHFDGVNDYVSVPSNSNLDLVSGTVECWVKPTTLVGGTCILGVRGIGGTRYSLHIRSNSIGMWNGISIYPVSYSFSTGQWYHLAFVSDYPNNRLHYYVNGLFIGSATNCFGSVTGQTLLIGAVKDSTSPVNPIELFNGAIDEIRIWSTMRTLEQIQTYKDVSLTGTENNLVALYNFNQGVADSINTSQSNVPDKTQNGHNGTLHNFALTGNASNFVSSILNDVVYQGTPWQTSGNAGTNPMFNALGTTDSQRLVFKTKNIERMTLLPNGNLGIGTAQPNHTLSIVGGNGFVVARAGETNRVAFGPNVNGVDWNIEAWNGGWGPDLMMDAKNVLIGTRNTNARLGIGTAEPKATLDVSGNIFTNGKLAIGTSDLSKIGDNSLAVNGNAVFNKVKVKLYNTSTGWADYVFKKNYRLLSLKQVEAYIKKYHHLPGVPAAEEVKKNDLDIGENQAVLLKKIEEAMLYIIEQNKKIEALQKQVKQLSNEKQK